MEALIGVTTYGRDGENRFHLFADYVDAVRRAGAAVSLLPPGEQRIERWLRSVDGVVLAGGGDLEPAVYGGLGVDATHDVDPERDRMELELAQRLLDSDLPVLGICRGMQVVNVVLGGDLIEHIPAVYGDDVVHRALPQDPVPHPVSLDPRSALARITGELEMSPHSWHHQCVGRLGQGLSAVAHAPDGVVEAAEIEGRPDWLLVQWHPELSAHRDAAQQRIFDWLIQRA